MRIRTLYIDIAVTQGVDEHRTSVRHHCNHPTQTGMQLWIMEAHAMQNDVHNLCGVTNILWAST